MGRTARPRGMRGGSVKSTWSEMQQLRNRVRDLEQMRERLSRLYFSQVETGKARMEKLHRILEVVTRLNSSLDIDSLLAQIVGAVQKSLGFRIVLLRILDPDSRSLRARAFAGLSGQAIRQLEAQDVPFDTFQSWLTDEFRVSRSYFISHKHSFSRRLPSGVVHDLGAREDWEWHEEDVLFVPLYTREGELMAYLSVDDPVDRLVPSRETIEMLEIFGNHVVVALENARLVQSLASHGRELEAANRRMGEVNQLKSSFLSAVSHELRTPLTSIRAYLDSLRDELLDREAVEAPLRFVGILEEEARRLNDLIDSVLSFSHLDRGSNPMEFKLLDAREAVRIAAAALLPLAEAKKVSLQTELPDADIRIEADLELLKQLLLHLGGNAVKFTAPGGEVRICARPDGDRGLVVTVSDSGIGIPENQLERIFERFYQVDQSLVRRFGGTGLGLALCKSIVEVHGGSIAVESAVGEGSTFTVRLPRRAPQRAQGTDAAPNRAGDADEALRMVLSVTAGVLGVDRVALLVPGPGEEARLRSSVGLPERATREESVPADRGLAGWVLERDEALVTPNPEKDPRLGGAHYRPLGTGPVAAVPVRHAGRVIGVMAAAFADEPDDSVVALMQGLGERVGNVLAQALKAAESQEALAQAAEALRGEVTRWSLGRAASSDRVRLARGIADGLGMEPTAAACVAWAAATSVTEDALADSRGEGGAEDRPEAVRRILAHRHERVDGTGTPQSLVGDEIELGARILAVTEAFESALHAEPGAGAEASARRTEQRIEELRARAGREFDPMVVEALVLVGVEEGWLDRGWALGPSDAADAA
jgi:signal transduction histidine kinase